MQPCIEVVREKDMVYCTSCGKKLLEDTKFCTACGTRVVPLGVEERLEVAAEELIGKVKDFINEEDFEGAAEKMVDKIKSFIDEAVPKSTKDKKKKDTEE
jgi:hypothetical protein